MRWTWRVILWELGAFVALAALAGAVAAQTAWLFAGLPWAEWSTFAFAAAAALVCTAVVRTWSLYPRRSDLPEWQEYAAQRWPRLDPATGRPRGNPNLKRRR